MKRALVTGSAGFVGKHMTAALEQRGYDVFCVDFPAFDALDVFRRDETRFALVVHCAAYVGGRAGIDGHPLYLASTDLELDAAMFRWALRTKPKRVVYFSSSAAYPAELQQDKLGPYPLRESDILLTDPLPPETVYGTVKLMGEQLAELANEAGIRTHVFRPFSGYGPGQALDYPCPSFIDRARRRADPFTIYSDGEQQRDFIYIDDVVAGVLACVDQDVLGPVNLCTGRGTSFTELADIVTKSAGYSPTFDYKLDAPRGVAYRVGDPTKLHEVYVPKVTVEQAVAEALREEAA